MYGNGVTLGCTLVEFLSTFTLPNFYRRNYFQHPYVKHLFIQLWNGNNNYTKKSTEKKDTFDDLMK